MIYAVIDVGRVLVNKCILESGAIFHRRRLVAWPINSHTAWPLTWAFELYFKGESTVADRPVSGVVQRPLTSSQLTRPASSNHRRRHLSLRARSPLPLLTSALSDIKYGMPIGPYELRCRAQVGQIRVVHVRGVFYPNLHIKYRFIVINWEQLVM